jgi:molybdenum cofactor cytidylyltransferase
MRFGPVPPDQAVGGVLAHGVKADALTLRKGRVITLDDAAALKVAGVAEVVVALAGPDDLGEDEAAAAVAEALTGAGVRADPPATGRANLFARHDGLLLVDGGRVDRLNALDEALTLATLPTFKPVVAGEMVGTVKIIPFAVDKALVAAGVAALSGDGPALTVKPFRSMRIAAVSTLSPWLKPSVVDKTVAIFARRLAALGDNHVSAEARTPHDVAPLAASLAQLAHAHDLIVVFGAAAITDRRDVIPAAIEAAGGEVIHLGMPVDPGNLLLIGRIGDRHVIGAPGCARSPAENGFDWVLQRMVAGVPIGRADIQAMGVGGLLMEIVSRPQPREGQPTVGALVLAAGRSTRMGANKLIATLDDAPVVRHAVATALDAGLKPVKVVTGHAAEAVHAALDGLDVAFVHNPAHASGMASSLQAGLDALPDGAQAVVVMLGDMPRVGPATLSALVAAHAANPTALAIVPTVEGRRANPVLLGRGLFSAVHGLTGDVGARKLIETLGAGVVEVEVGDQGALIDVDTPEALETARRIRG